MLGGNLLVAKMAVFALAAGMAGLGGAVYAMQQQSVTASQFSLVAGLPIFLVAVVGGLAVAGDGLFTGTALEGPLNALIAVAPWLQNLVALLPALAGAGLSRNPQGVVPAFRRQWEPVARDRLALPVLLGGLALAWALRLAHVINGWELFGVVLVLALAAPPYAAWRQAMRAELDIPVEWWGVRRPWRPEDEEVLVRGVTGG
jgi:branched-chain amino acid transport system permease protein